MKRNKGKRCQNVLYHNDAKFPNIRCYRRAVVTRGKGMSWEFMICSDCADNSERKLRARALKKWIGFGYKPTKEERQSLKTLDKK